MNMDIPHKLITACIGITVGLRSSPHHLVFSQPIGTWQLPTFTLRLSLQLPQSPRISHSVNRANCPRWIRPSMEKPSRRKGFAPRSRSGCLECRQHHRKCDERRPTCTLCEKYSRNCEYGLRITWGGRPFRKSTFGKCMLESSSQPMPVIQIQSADIDARGIVVSEITYKDANIEDR